MRAAAIQQAMQDWGCLLEGLPQLTEEEVLHCLELEAGTTRRRSWIKRLIQRAVRINEVNYANSLKERYLKNDHNSPSL